MRYCLKYSVQGVESQTSKRGESILLVVDVMCRMKILIKRFYVVQLPVHPVNPKLHKYEIQN